MDQDRFDDLTRALASTTSRRTVLKTLAGSAAGGLLALLGVHEAAADDTCKPTGKKCRKGAQCCSGNCEAGVCAPACTPSGLQQLCSSPEECCSGFCEPILDFPPRCCIPPGTKCDTYYPEQCCSGTCHSISGCR